MLTLFDKKNERLLFEMKKQLKIEEIGVQIWEFYFN